MQNEFRKDYVLMAARILNFILKYGFINEEKENSSIYSQAQKIYSSLPAINLNTRISMFRKDDGQ